MKKRKANTVQDHSEKCLTEERQILSRWIEYCSELYNHKALWRSISTGLSLDTHRGRPPRPSQRSGIQSLRKRKSAGVDNIPAELGQAGGDYVLTALTTICYKIWRTGEWPTSWTRSLVSTVPKKGNLQQCQNYRTISLIIYPSSHAEDHIEEIEATSGKDHS